MNNIKNYHSIFCMLFLHSLTFVEKVNQSHSCLQTSPNFNQSKSSLKKRSSNHTASYITVQLAAYLSRCSVTIPFGVISTDLPQNFSFGWMAPWNVYSGDSTWKAETGGWWLTCSHTTRNPRSSLQPGHKVKLASVFFWEIPGFPYNQDTR